jgi:hypothetical protein
MGERNVVTFLAQLGKRGKETNKKPQKAFIYFDSDASEPLAGGGVGSSNLPVPPMKLAISRPLSDVSSRFNRSHRSGRRTKKSTFDRADQSLTIEESFFAPRWLRATSSKVFPERG